MRKAPYLTQVCAFRLCSFFVPTILQGTIYPTNKERIMTETPADQPTAAALAAGAGVAE
jgi:hypothetical protein